jgi:ABC-type lipoprotein release transport system permease subunit
MMGPILQTLLEDRLQSMLFEVRSTDPMVLAFTTLVLLAAAALAMVFPARRAVRIDPMAALREE